MKANLPQAEPKRLAAWKAENLQVQASRGDPRFILRRPPSPMAKSTWAPPQQDLKDVVVHALAGFDAPYVPGWDCHACHRAASGQNLGPKKELSAVEFRQAATTPSSWPFVRRLRTVRRDGQWETPYLTMSPQYQATIVRQLAAFVEKGWSTSQKSVHWCISCQRAGRGRGRVRREPRQPRSTCLRPGREGEPAWRPASHSAGEAPLCKSSGPPRRGRCPRTSPLAFRPDADYACYPVGDERRAGAGESTPDAAEARFWGADKQATGAALAEAKGTD